MLSTLRQLLSHLGTGEQMEQRDMVGLRLACVTNTGHHRPHNEDNYLFFGQSMPQEHQSLERPLFASALPGELVCAAVFDGMGGELAGELASHAAALALRDAQDTLVPDEPSVLTAFRAMQDSVSAARINARLSSCGSTATILVAQDTEAIVANLGDSPAFLLRDGVLTRLSKAHTDEELLRELGLDRKPGLTQFLGMDESDAPIEPHVCALTLAGGDRILLASDGLTDMVDERYIAEALGAARDPEALVGDLLVQALDAGGVDNITLIACEVTTRTTSRTR